MQCVSHVASASTAYEIDVLPGESAAQRFIPPRTTTHTHKEVLPILMPPTPYVHPPPRTPTGWVQGDVRACPPTRTFLSPTTSDT